MGATAHDVVPALLNFLCEQRLSRHMAKCALLALSRIERRYRDQLATKESATGGVQPSDVRVITERRVIITSVVHDDRGNPKGKA